MADSKAISLAPHLWEALNQMSAEMGVPTDALIAQAVYTLARLNGFVVPGKVSAPAPSVASRPAQTAVAPVAPAAPVAPPAPAYPAPTPAAKPVTTRPPPRRPEPVPEPEPELDMEPEPEPEPELPPEDDSNPFDQQDEELPPEEDYEDEPQDDYEEEPEPEPSPAPPPARGGKATLTLFVTGRDPFKMAGDVFTIGRGKSCDFVIESNRVSREHVRVMREGADFVLEDLNSSNGTFFGPAKEKVTRRKIKDGDEFTLGTEKVKFQIRK
jgi:pSer/pThr/pTyr-binding forkhead associated (FHA) protein